MVVGPIRVIHFLDINMYRKRIIIENWMASFRGGTGFVRQSEIIQ